MAGIECLSAKVNAEEIVILTDDEIARVRQRVVGRSIAPIISTALATGARRGELLALRIKDFDEKAALGLVSAKSQERTAGLGL
jgi:integrase